jgi:hypothetical protein
VKNRTLCFCFYALIASTVPLLAQVTPPPTTPPEPTPSGPTGPYVRRISAGGTLSFLLVGLMTTGETHPNMTTPPIEATATGESKAHMFGAGGQVQVALFNRWSVNLGFISRNTGYKLTTTSLVGTRNTNLSYDDRAKFVRTEVTTANYWDFPALLRVYNISHDTPGWRYFYEAGPVLRHVRQIRSQVENSYTGYYKNTSTQITYTSCCDATPTRPSKANLLGVMVGVGVHIIDDFGIKMGPELRYTRWIGRTFDASSAQSRRDQIELLLSFNF